MDSEAPTFESLELVKRFLNTLDTSPYSERFASPESATAWLVQEGLLPDDRALCDPEVRALVEVREAMRALAFANAGDELDREALRTLDRAAAAARLAVRFEDRGSARLVPDAHGVDHAIGSLIAIVFEAMADGTWGRLRACRDHTCGWAFIDTSKNASKTWCSMRVCGNRAKARAYRERHKPDHAEAGSTEADHAEAGSTEPGAGPAGHAPAGARS